MMDTDADTDDSPGFTLFNSPIGPCALVWSALGVVGVALPGANAAATRAQVQRRFRGASERVPPPAVQRAVERVLALLGGARDDLQDIVLDLRGLPDFHTRVYAIARRIPPGATRSYGEIARALGEPPVAGEALPGRPAREALPGLAAREALPGLAARAVGQALGANPIPIIVPCHRVLAAGHRAGGFSAPGGTRTKLRLLEIEGAPLGGTPGLFDA